MSGRAIDKSKIARRKALAQASNIRDSAESDYFFQKADGGVSRDVVAVERGCVTLSCGHHKTVSNSRLRFLISLGRGTAKQLCFRCKASELTPP